MCAEPAEMAYAFGAFFLIVAGSVSPQALDAEYGAAAEVHKDETVQLCENLGDGASNHCNQVGEEEYGIGVQATPNIVWDERICLSIEESERDVHAQRRGHLQPNP